MNPISATETRHDGRPGPTGLFCSPPRLESDTRSKRLADRLLPTGRAQWVFFALVWAAIALRPNLGVMPGLLLAGVATLAAAGWCLVNFWRCREAHCALSAPGWTMLGTLESIEAAIGRSMIAGLESICFIAILVLAYVFEFTWRARNGTNALTH